MKSHIYKREERGEVTTLSPTTRAYRSCEEDNIQYIEQNTSSDDEE